jgi:hypothetical protein
VKTPIYDKAEFKGFTEAARVFTKVNYLVAEKPEKTAAQVVRAIKRDRFIVVTTPLRGSVLSRGRICRVPGSPTRACSPT